MIIKIVVLADTHVGSNYGLCPRSYFNEHTNAYQLWAINKWDEFIETYKYPDYLILNGDIADGPAKKDPSVLCISDADEQVKSAIELISPIIGKNTEVHGVSGSGYHTGKGSGFDADKQITEKLIEIHGIRGCHHKTEFGLSLSKYGMKNISFRHKGKNEKTEAMVAYKRYYKTHAPKIEMIVASHLHRIKTYTDGVSVYHTPCWEWETDFMDFVEPVDIGSMIIYVDIGRKKIDAEFYCPEIPTELYEDMQHWESISTEREMFLIKKEKEKENKEIEKLAKVYNKIPKNDLKNIVKEVKKQEEEKYKGKITTMKNMELPKSVNTIKKKENKKEIIWPKLPI
jgi:hypothetical protein